MTKPNFNARPYYDDFDANKKFTKILFRPERAVQARELTQIQTILQNQIEQGSKFFAQHGDCIVPGELSFDLNVPYIKV